eukprot:3632509-Pyramimonas_sp.AAC.1
MFCCSDTQDDGPSLLSYIVDTVIEYLQPYTRPQTVVVPRPYPGAISRTYGSVDNTDHDMFGCLVL